MAIAIQQTVANGPTNPVAFFASIRPGPDGDASDNQAGAGFLVDPTSLTYRLVNPDGTELQATTAVNLVAEKLGEGRFAPVFTIDVVGGSAPASDVGPDYTIEWVAIIPFGSGSVTQNRTTTFRLVKAGATIPDAYALIEDLREEGVPTAGIFTDPRLKIALERAKELPTMGSTWWEKLNASKPAYYDEICDLINAWIDKDVEVRYGLPTKRALSKHVRAELVLEDVAVSESSVVSFISHLQSNRG